MVDVLFGNWGGDQSYQLSAAAGGGGSGGGSINVFTDEYKLPEGASITSFFDVSGGNGGSGTGTNCNYNGGNGGTGTCNIGSIASGTYISSYHN